MAKKTDIQTQVKNLLASSQPRGTALSELIKTPGTLRKKGEAHPQSKLTDAEVRTVNEMLMAGSSQRYIAQVFNVSQSLVKRIKAGQR